ncbi:LON peptidase substrate-binding domain-containing protein [Leptolyngbya sp. FACHB-321]|uniref:LON peptidase substrate-binding domain-containing protein n=1 Tax=Leptolyngbya sp. FACHB-321 TaxID=2692807 RepID=UPI001687AB30|nr:LON peptidase substrate-binding domain-containing protein [Leptolyngbya sp. FACHB-321]MBD2038223.1 LON peptidase substrate-binding domain-containing protein [Leptolyngbya sp. FACHB-321]
MSNELNFELSGGTDVAKWFLFHPEDLAHRWHAPPSWWIEDFAVSKEFAAGSLVAVSTGKDGGFKIRFTNRGLTEREQTYVRKTAAFRLRVLHGRLYLDGGWAVPEVNQINPEECYSSDDAWITLPNGDYRATVYAIAWFEEPGAMDENGYSTPQALTTYVVELQSVASLEEIVPPTSIPDLDPILYTFEDSDLPEAAWLTNEEYTEPLAPVYPLLYWHEVIFPGIEQEFSLEPDAPFEVVDGQMVISYSIDEQAIGTLFSVSQMPSRNMCYLIYSYHMERLQRYDYDYLQGVGTRLVRLNRVFEKEEDLWVEVEPYEPPPVSVDLCAIARLKQLFADYADKNATYQERIQFHHFYAERVASLTNPRELGWFIANAIDFNGDQQQALLTLSDADLIEALTQALERRLSE